MKGILAGALMAALAVSAAAQGTFTIRRPVDGAKVREVVKLRVPKTSIPEGGYLGLYINGRFVEAAMPAVEGSDAVYSVDTQARGLADGPAKLELALFRDVDGKSREIGRSSVTVVVDNVASIGVPAEGIALRYRFVPGTERVYTLTLREESAFVSQAQARLGSRAANFQETSETIRLLFAVDNVYRTPGGTEGLVRMQGLPDRGRDFTMVTLAGDTTPSRISGDQFVSTYIRMTDVGREVSSSAPVYWGLEGVNGRTPGTAFWAIYPKPVLPTRKVKPGDVWQAAYSFSEVNPRTGEHLLLDRFFRTLPARGTFEGVTWYKGIPCARIKTTVSVGAEDLKGIDSFRNIPGEALKVDLTETTLFALDRGIVVRTEVQQTAEALVDAPAGGGGFGGDGGAGPRGGGGGGGIGTATPGGGGPPRGGRGRLDDEDRIQGPGLPGQDEFRQTRGGAMSVGQGPGDRDDDERGVRDPGGGRFGQGRTGGTGRQRVILRFRSSAVLELER